jgi:hypothetical protein
MKELYERFPDIIKMLLQKATQTSYGEESEKIRNARSRLLSKLNDAADEMSKLSNLEGEGLTEEHIKKISKIPRSLPDSMKWKIKPRRARKKVDKKVSDTSSKTS